MKLQPFAIAIIFFIFCFPVFSQETPDNSQLMQASPAEIKEQNGNSNEDTIYIINSLDFNIKGRTRPYAVIHKAELKEGEEIKGLEKLEKYILDKTQLLVNERVLEKASIDYTIGQAREDGKYPVDLVINLFDSWNIIALPKPEYNSNSGFDITLKARDYNFFGSMNPLRIDLGYTYDEDKNSTFLLELDSNTPFKAFGYMWNFKFVHTFNYRPDVEEPYFYKNITGLSMELPFKTTTFTFGFEESVVFNQENSDDYKPIYGDFQSGIYMSTKPFISWKIPTGIEVGAFGPLNYTPQLAATFYHEFPKWELQEIRKGPVLSLSHELGFNRVDWIGNYRKGLDVYIDNSYSYDFYKPNIDTPEINNEPWRADVKFSTSGYFIVNDFIGFSARLMYRHWFFYENGNGSPGDALRGILDRSFRTEYMLSINMDFPVKVLSFTPSRWFNSQKMRLFNFDLHLSPIIDMAVFYGPLTDRFFNTRDFLVSGGMEAIVFPGFFRAFYLRVSAACDLQKYLDEGSMIPTGNNREIFIGIGHHY